MRDFFQIESFLFLKHSNVGEFLFDVLLEDHQPISSVSPLTLGLLHSCHVGPKASQEFVVLL